MNLFKHEMSVYLLASVYLLEEDIYKLFVSCWTSRILILFTHQQMHFLLNLEKFKFILKYT